MRKFASLIMAGCLVALAGCGVPNPSEKSSGSAKDSKNEKEVVVVAGGVGVIEEVMRDVIIPKFEKETGIKVNYTPSPSNETISKVEIQRNAPKTDVIYLDPTVTGIAVNKGLAEKVDTSKIPNLSNVDEKYIMIPDYSTPIFGYVLGPAYNTELFTKENLQPIQSWNDLLRPEYKGRTAYGDATVDPGFTILYNLALANGGSLDNLQPGLEKAKELAKVSDTFYKASPQMMAALQQGAMVTVLHSYSIGQLVDQGIPLKLSIPKEGAPLQSVSAVTVKNAPHKSAAEKFENFLLSKEIQEALTDKAFYSVLKGMKVSAKYEDSISIKETDKTYKPQIQKLSEVRPAALDQWKKEVAPNLGKR